MRIVALPTRFTIVDSSLIEIDLPYSSSSYLCFRRLHLKQARHGQDAIISKDQGNTPGLPRANLVTVIEHVFFCERSAKCLALRR